MTKRATMKFDGGYSVMLDGEPAPELIEPDLPQALHLPLFSRRYEFSRLQVEDGQAVGPGEVLATDPVNFSVPLLAPVGGTVDLETVERHITLNDLDAAADQATADIDDEPRLLLRRLGVWSFLARLSSGKVPDPEDDIEALVISPTRLEPFHPRPEIYLQGAVERFAAGLKRIHRALGDVGLYLVLPKDDAPIGAELRRAIAEAGAWLTLFEAPATYPHESPALAAQMLGLDLNTAWTIDAQAVLGAERALHEQRPFTHRIVSVGGPLAEKPCHYRVPVGFPLAGLTAAVEPDAPARVVAGGVLTGTALDPDQQGLDAECVALTMLRENTTREVLAFVQPGTTTQSYSRTFVSVFRPLFPEKFTTALRGEARPCVFCGYCESVCPAGIIPHLVHRYLEKDRPEDAYRVGLEKCIACGLCSYVCLSKIEHLQVFVEEKQNSSLETEEG